ncbi:iron ABC transporter permease [Rubrobacter taiwanensis]|jgi:iron(III) transport system permease protein|uniref:Iron ABC transporter permease n=2 Tax=Rubrobacter taiwanensis TaxID=185139 RepID=A0A4R1BRY9_9ACTN|nr:iron ABC transporter permease [Rubrobacter taiwanensis]
MLLPPAYLFVRSFEDGVGNVLEVALEGRTLAVLLRSVVLAAAVTAATVLVAVPLAWLTARTDLPGRDAWTVLAALPLVIPSYVGGFVFVSMLGPRGILQGHLERLFGIQELPSIYGFPGAFLALTLFTYPYVFLTVRAALRGMDPALEEAARSLGSSGWETFFRVTLPQLRPAAAAGALLVALYVLSDFGAVSLLQYDSFTRAIYIQYRAAFDRTPAAIMGLMLIMLTLAILYVEARTRGRARYHRSTAGAVRPAPTVRLGGWKWPALAYCGTIVALALIMPVGVLGFWLARGLAHGEPLRLVWDAALNSVYVSSLAALATALAALPVAILAVRFPGAISGAIERLTYVGFALPGIVLALSLVFFGSNYAPWLYQGLAMLIFAYAVHFLPQAIGSTRAALLQASPRVEEAARSLGRSPLKTMATVTAPLARSGILAGMALVFLTTMKELPATLLLSPTGFDTLATRIWTATSEAFFARAAAPALLLIAVSAIPMYLLTIRDRMKL